MANPAKTLIATGVSSGLGFELIKQLLLDQPAPYKLILGIRDPSRTGPELDQLKYDKTKHDVSLLKADFADLGSVRTFAKDALAKLGSNKLDYLLMNQGLVKAGPGPKGSPWSEMFIVNHQSQHYLMHLLRDQLIASHTRIVFVSSGAIRSVKSADDVASLRSKVAADTTLEPFGIYGPTKFIQLLGAHYWRRQLGDKASVVAVSPGMIPGTQLGRYLDVNPLAEIKDGKDVPTGARSLLEAFHRSDLPADPNSIFLTSWGEWWDPNEIFPLSLNAKLQDQWCPSQAEIEKEAKL